MENSESDDLLSRAKTCRRLAATMGLDPRAATLIEIAEDYEKLAAKLTDEPRHEPPLA